MECFLCYMLAAAALLIPAVCYFIFNKIFVPEKAADLCKKHVLITGGSSGIGLAVAAEVVAAGANVTLVARDRTKLEQAQQNLQAAAGKDTKVHIRPFDVCGGGTEELVCDVEAALGPVYMLVNCAGYSTPARFEDLSMKECKRMMDVNFFGSFAVTQAVVRRMKQREHRTDGERAGIVVLTSSQGGLLGIYGFTAYAAAKAALIKFGEALHMEVTPHHLSVTVCVPPDTDTPGFEQENLAKPAETRIISESAGLFTAEAVAKSLVQDALAGRFYSTVGLEGFMITTLCAGMGPITHFGDWLAQVFLSGIFRSVSAFILFNFQRIVHTEQNKRTASKKRE